jgi:hypothetical protein
MTPPLLSRRTVLRGTAAALALPWLESLLPRSAWAAPPPRPLRLAFLYVPNGADMANWTPKSAEPGFTLPYALEPLAPVRAHVTVLTGLAHRKADANGDGPGDHARAGATFLTGCQARKTSGADLRVGVSVDQVAARRVGNATRLPSLELGLEPGAVAGECDSGYSCAYSSNLSWRSESSPMGKETDPRQVFERLFGDEVPGATPEERARRAKERRSVLDYVREDATRLAARMGASDRRKMDEYLTAVRELERRLARAEGEAGGLPPGADGGKAPTAVPATFEEHAKTMLDLLALGFRTDQVRVATLMLANEGSNRSYPSVCVKNGHHEISHHGKDDDKLDKVRRINRLHVEMLAHFLGRLAAAPEGDGTLLDGCAVAYGSAIGDGDRHDHDDLPLLLAGRGGGTLTPGRHLRLPAGTPVANLWLSLLDRVDARLDRFGDSTGRLADL